MFAMNDIVFITIGIWQECQYGNGDRTALFSADVTGQEGDTDPGITRPSQVGFPNRPDS